MRPSPVLLRKGFWSRSVDELKRWTQSVVRLDSIHTPMVPFNMLDFKEPSSLEDIRTMCDEDIGGFSSVNIEHRRATKTEPAHMRWFGKISTDLPRNRPQVQRSGYAAWRNKDRPPTVFGKSLWDFDQYTWLCLKVKSDGRRYFVNLQSETIVPTDIHQHRLYVKEAGKWETVMIRIKGFVRTNHGFVVEPQDEIMADKLRTVGIGSTDRVVGPYDLSVARIWGTNRDDGWHPDDGTPEPPPKEQR